MERYKPDHQPAIHVYGWNTKPTHKPSLLGVVHSESDVDALIASNRESVGAGYVFFAGGPLAFWEQRPDKAAAR